MTKKYIYSPGMDHPVAMINVDWQGGETWHYYYADALGSRVGWAVPTLIKMENSN